MEIDLPKYGLFSFEKDKDSTGDTSVSDILWVAEKTIDGTEVEFNFSIDRTQADEVPWVQIREVLQGMDGALSDLAARSVPVLTSLYHSIFQKEFNQLGAHFLLEDVEVLVSNFMRIESLNNTSFIGPAFRLGFCIEPLEDQYELIDPHFSYYASFNHNGVLCGVARE